MSAPYNSIFGVQCPKFKFSTDADVELTYAVIEVDEPDVKRTTHESIITKAKSYSDFGVHYNFEVLEYLYKYGATAQTKFTTIYGYKDKLVKLWRRKDKNHFMNSASGIVYFKITEVIPIWFNSPERSDMLRIKFESTALVDLTKLLS